MKLVEISKAQFIKDVETMTVEEIKEKYDLNNGSYYSILRKVGLEPNRRAERKTFKVVD